MAHTDNSARLSRRAIFALTAGAAAVAVPSAVLALPSPAPTIPFGGEGHDAVIELAERAVEAYRAHEVATEAYGPFAVSIGTASPWKLLGAAALQQLR